MLRAVASLIVLAMTGAGLANCAWVGACGFDESSYAQLRRGMSHDDVVQIVGCRGMSTSPPDGKPQESTYRAWPGPRGPVTVEFASDRVESWRVSGTRF